MCSTDTSECRVVLCTCPDAETAERLATGIVEARLAVCVNIVDGIRSIYRWQEEVHGDSEALMIIKTTSHRYAVLERWLAEQHPYDVPEVLALPVAAGLGAYLDWVASQAR